MKYFLLSFICFAVSGNLSASFSLDMSAREYTEEELIDYVLYQNQLRNPEPVYDFSKMTFVKERIIAGKTYHFYKGNQDCVNSYPISWQEAILDFPSLPVLREISQNENLSRLNKLPRDLRQTNGGNIFIITFDDEISKVKWSLGRNRLEFWTNAEVELIPGDFQFIRDEENFSFMLQQTKVDLPSAQETIFQDFNSTEVITYNFETDYFKEIGNLIMNNMIRTITNQRESLRIRNKNKESLSIINKRLAEIIEQRRNGHPEIILLDE